jgi:hypothetical protein
METAMVAADHDAAMYQQRMRDYDEEVRNR